VLEFANKTKTTILAKKLGKNLDDIYKPSTKELRKSIIEKSQSMIWKAFNFYR